MKQAPRNYANDRLQQPTTEEIAAAAYHLYLENGCRDGHDLDDWLRAEKLLTQHVEEFAEVQSLEPARKAVSRASEIPPGEPQEHSQPLLNKAQPGARKSDRKRAALNSR